MNNVLLALLLLFQGVVVPGAAGTIEGRILNLDGTPAARVRVTAQAVAESPLAAVEAPIFTSIVQTDATGRYLLEGVAPGRYYIGAGPVNLPIYFPGVRAINAAQIVTLANGGALTGIDFKMEPAGAGLKISGRVKLEPGITLPSGARVSMTGTSGNRNMVLAADKTFEFDSLPPGRYTIFVQPLNGSPPTQVMLTDKDLDIDVVVKVTVAVTGRIIFGTDEPRPRLTLNFVDGLNRFDARPGANGRTFQLQLPTGDYRAEVTSLPPGFSVRSIVAGDANLLLEAVHVAPGKPLDFAVIVDAASPPPWVRVSGHIKGLHGAATPETRDIVQMTGANAGETLQATVSSDGRFEFPQVIPGPYVARVGSGASVQIEVGPTDVENLEILVPIILNIAGRLTIEGATVSSIPLVFTLSGSGRTTRTQSTPGSSGTFTLSVLEGQYQIGLNTQLTGMSGFSVKSMTYGDVDLLTSPAKFDPADTNKELRVTLVRAR